MLNIMQGRGQLLTILALCRSNRVLQSFFKFFGVDRDDFAVLRRVRRRLEVTHNQSRALGLR
jgi:hypothetical protein